MQMKLFCGVATAMMVLAANANDGVASSIGFKPYVSVFAGGSLPSDLKIDSSGTDHYTFNFDAGYLYGAAIGANLTDNIRVEAEVSRTSWKSGGDFSSIQTSGLNTNTGTAHGDFSATYLLGNIWIDLPNSSALTPYGFRKHRI
jgi:hypothetical protein